MYLEKYKLFVVLKSWSATTRSQKRIVTDGKVAFYYIKLF